MENSPVNSLPPFQCWPEKSLASLYKTIAVATKIISHLSNIEKGEGGGGRLCILGNHSNNYVTDCSFVVQ